MYSYGDWAKLYIGKCYFTNFCVGVPGGYKSQCSYEVVQKYEVVYIFIAGDSGKLNGFNGAQSDYLSNLAPTAECNALTQQRFRISSIEGMFAKLRHAE